jgi:hypothetical protein
MIIEQEYPGLGRVTTTQDFYAKLVRRDTEMLKYEKMLPRRKTFGLKFCVVVVYFVLEIRSVLRIFDSF